MHGLRNHRATKRGRCANCRREYERERSARRRASATQARAIQVYHSKQWALRRKVVLDVDPICKACGERLSSQVRAEGPGGANVPGEPLRSPGAGGRSCCGSRPSAPSAQGWRRAVASGSAGCAVAGPTAAAPVYGGCCVRSSRAPRPRGHEGVVSRRAELGPRRALRPRRGAVLWRQSLRRLWAAFVSRQSDRAAVRPRRKNRSMRRLNLALGRRARSRLSASRTRPRRRSPRQREPRPDRRSHQRAEHRLTDEVVASLRAHSERRRPHRLKDLADSLDHRHVQVSQSASPQALCNSRHDTSS